MKKSKVSLLLIIVILLSGCSTGKDKEVVKEDKKKELNILVPCYGGEKENDFVYELDKYDDEFEKKYDVKINYIKSGENSRDEFEKKLATKLYTSHNYDLIYLENFSDEVQTVKERLSNSEVCLSLKENLKNYNEIPKGLKSDYFVPVLVTRAENIVSKEKIDLAKIKNPREHVKENGFENLRYISAGEKPIKINMYYLMNQEKIDIKIEKDKAKISKEVVLNFLEKIKGRANDDIYGIKDKNHIWTDEEYSKNQKIEIPENKKIEYVLESKMWTLGDEISYSGMYEDLKSKKEDIFMVVDDTNAIIMEKGYMAFKNADDLALKYIDFMIGENIQKRIFDDVIRKSNKIACKSEFVNSFGPMSNKTIDWIGEIDINEINRNSIESFFRDLNDDEWISENIIYGDIKLAQKIFRKEMKLICEDYLTGKEFTDKELQKIIDEIEFKINIRLGEM